MNTEKIVATIFLITILTTVLLMGCTGNLGTVETCVISNQQYNDKDVLESVAQPEDLEAGQDIYASVRFIESPLGMEYTGKWSIDGNEVKRETKEMLTDKSGIVIFTLEEDKITAETVLFEILHGDDVLFSKEMSVH